MATDRSQAGNSQKLSSALNEAQNIVSAAEKRAAQLRIEAEKVYQESQEKGYEAGFAAGHREAVATAVRLVQDTTSLGEKLSEEAARLALAICATVVGEHVKVEPDVVKRIALTALQESVVGDAVTLVVHPDDKPILTASSDQLRRIAGGVNVAIDTDSSLTRGGCIVRTEFGEVDATVEALLNGVASRLGISRNG